MRERIEHRDQIRTEINSKSLVETHRWERPNGVAAKTEPAQPAAKSEAPEIHISIGRIEVRASVTTPTPAQAPRSTEPKLSLDEYLKSRSGVSR